jgi:uncharacterized spore protein YtfJ
MAGEDAIKATVDELLKALSARNIIGEPIEMEDKIIIPITKMGMGFGTGIGHGREESPQGRMASGAGGGVGVFPVAVVVVFKGVPGADGLKVIPMTAHSSMTDPVTSIAQILLEKLGGHREIKEKKPGNLRTIEIE